MPTTTEYEIRPARSDADLLGILALQAANQREALAEEDRRSQGFVSLRHDLGLLREMNAPWPHIVATPAGRGEVVAYALVMLPAFRGRMPELEAMFERLDRLEHRGRALGALRWYVMGQVCVAREHRGRGLMERLYDAHRERMSADFDVMVTEIDRANGRSMRAHERAGFETLCEYRSEDGREWVVVGLGLGSRRT